MLKASARKKIARWEPSQTQEVAGQFRCIFKRVCSKTKRPRDHAYDPEAVLCSKTPRKTTKVINISNEVSSRIETRVLAV